MGLIFLLEMSVLAICYFIGKEISFEIFGSFLYFIINNFFNLNGNISKNLFDENDVFF